MTHEQTKRKLESSTIKNVLDLGYLEIKRMNRITANVIIRIGDNAAGKPLYGDISRKSLDINLPIGNISIGNRARRDITEGLGLANWDKEKPYIDFVKVFIEENPFIHVKY